MKVQYFPGCTLKNKAKQLDIYARQCAEVLGVTLEEPKEWQCCGGAFTAASDEIATKLSSVRLLKAAAEQGEALVTVCSACHNVVKQTNYAMQTNPTFADRVNRYFAQENAAPYAGDAQVYHYLELLRDVVGFDAVKNAVKNPLSGKKIAAYYGCLLLRPSKVIAMDDPENPRIMEDLIRAMGAEPVIWARRNECCGGYISLKEKELSKSMCNNIMDSADGFGAEMLITACPLCQYNLTNNSNAKVPVVYFTEILAEALGVKEEVDAK